MEAPLFLRQGLGGGRLTGPASGMRAARPFFSAYGKEGKNVRQTDVTSCGRTISRAQHEKKGKSRLYGGCGPVTGASPVGALPAFA